MLTLPASSTSHPSGWSLGLDVDITDFAETIALLQQGIPMTAARHLQRESDVKPGKLAEILGISERTLQRRNEDGLLKKEESERLVRFARVFEDAVEVIGDPASARMWLRRRQYGLGGRVPLDMISFEVGAEEVQALLTRMYFGYPV